MEKNKVLYQIKLFDNLILRYFFSSKKCDMPTPTQMQIMEYLMEHCEEDIYQKDLEDILNLRRATVSGVLQTMEKNRLIERMILENDGRSKKIIITNQAKQIFKKNLEKLESIKKIIMKDIKEEELASFSRTLGKMQKNLEIEMEN